MSRLWLTRFGGGLSLLLATTALCWAHGVTGGDQAFLEITL
jgi:hypothetical protein